MDLSVDILENLCRICLLDQNILTPIDNNIIIMIENCLDIKLIIVEPLPNKICKNCYELIKSTTVLKNMIEFTDQKLNRFLNESDINLKIETDLCNDDNVDPKTKNNNDSMKNNGKQYYNSNIKSEEFTKEEMHILINEDAFQEAHEGINQELFNGKNENFKNKLISKDSKLNGQFNKANFKIEKFDTLCTNNKNHFNQITIENPIKNNETKKVFKCSICGKISSTKCNLQVHMKKHNRLRQVKCKYCGMIYTTLMRLQVHQKRIHGTKPFTIDVEINELNDNSFDEKLKQFEESMNQCQICKKEFSSNSDLVKHMKNNGDGSHLKCKYCNKVYISSRFLKQHEQNHEKTPIFTKQEQPENLEFKCDVCEKMCATKYGLHFHKKTHSKDKEQFKCEICGSIYLRLCSLKAHQEKHKLENVLQEKEKQQTETNLLINNSIIKNEKLLKNSRQFKCAECEKQLFSRRGYLRHVKAHEESNKIQCSLCNKEFTKAYMPLHIKKEHSGETKVCEICLKLVRNYEHHKKKHLQTMDTDDQIECAECGKKFNSTTQINSHIAIVHFELKKNICHICGRKVLGGMYNFKRHVSIHLENKTHICNLCEKGYATVDLLIEHKKQTHEMIKKFKCPKCPKKFKKKYLLNQHYRKHINYRPYKCTFCPKAFFDKKTMEEHLNTHTGNRPFICNACGDTFCFSAALFNHKRFKHKNRENV